MNYLSLFFVSSVCIALELNITDKVCLGLQAYSLKLQPCQVTNLSIRLLLLRLS